MVRAEHKWSGVTCASWGIAIMFFDTHGLVIYKSQVSYVSPSEMFPSALLPSYSYTASRFTHIAFHIIWCSFSKLATPIICIYRYLIPKWVDHG